MHDERERFLIPYAGGFAPFTVARADGAWIETTNGRRILDFISGQVCSTLGHNHPRIAQAVQATLVEAVHLNSWMLSEPVLALAPRLISHRGWPAGLYSSVSADATPSSRGRPRPSLRPRTKSGSPW